MSNEDPVRSCAAFRELHAKGGLLLLPNAWDAASARLVEDCGARAVATSSAALAWAHGFADGHALPARVLVGAIAEIARVVRVPISADVEGGYSDDPDAVADVVAAVVDAGAVGINLEDGPGSPELLCAKIDAAKRGAARAGRDVFVNARCDVYLRGLVAPERALAATLERVARYRAAGCDGVFVPRLAQPDEIRAVVQAIDPLPLNLLAGAGLAPPAELARLGVRRLSAGSALAAAVLAELRRLATSFLAGTDSGALFGRGVDYGAMNAMLGDR